MPKLWLWTDKPFIRSNRRRNSPSADGGRFHSLTVGVQQHLQIGLGFESSPTALKRRSVPLHVFRCLWVAAGTLRRLE